MVTQWHTGRWLIIKLIITYLLPVIMFLFVAALPEECMYLILPATAFQYHVLMASVYQIHCIPDAEFWKSSGSSFPLQDSPWLASLTCNVLPLHAIHEGRQSRILIIRTPYQGKHKIKFHA